MSVGNEPLSRLTRERPDIWRDAVALATRVTGYQYPHKAPLADGTIYACGGAPLDPNWKPPAPLTPEEQLDVDIKEAERVVEYWRGVVEFDEKHGYNSNYSRKQEREERERLAALIKRRSPAQAGSAVLVPEGAMEWLLHEVGHWVAATPDERARPNYGLGTSEVGHDGLREWQAWAFEELVLAPFGTARLFAPPTQRDGAAFARSGPMPAEHLAHAEASVRALGFDAAEFRALYARWVRWGTAIGRRAPWRTTEGLS